MMTEQEVDQLAGQIADRLHASVLKIPAVVAEHLKEFSGWQSYTDLCGGPWPFRMRTRILADGGILLQILTADGQQMLERVLSP